MGVTDCHVHINPIEEMRPENRALLTRLDPGLIDLLRDPARFLSILDDAGVERAVLINYVSPEVIGYTEYANEFSARYASADPRRLIAVGGIRPDHPDPRREIRRLVRDLGIRGLKLHPPHQLFAPNDYRTGARPSLAQIYRACEEERIPVIFHTGTSIFPKARSRYGEPLAVEDVAIDFPDLTIVLAHAGRPLWMDQAVFLARRFPRVWLELSGIPPDR
ncbi:MAG: amidohydrolase family protein, partial [Thermoplasmata archaeon]